MLNNSRNQFRKYNQNRRKRSQAPSVLNETFIIKKIQETTENRTNYPSLDEAASRLLRVSLDRSSSPNHFNFCDHCSHNHAQQCCMYVHDDWSDIERYANFKSEIDEPYWAINSSEDFDLSIGNTTPKYFPSKKNCRLKEKESEIKFCYRFHRKRSWQNQQNHPVPSDATTASCLPQTVRLADHFFTSTSNSNLPGEFLKKQVSTRDCQLGLIWGHDVVFKRI